MKEHPLAWFPVHPAVLHELVVLVRTYPLSPPNHWRSPTSRSSSATLTPTSHSSPLLGQCLLGSAGSIRRVVLDDYERRPKVKPWRSLALAASCFTVLAPVSKSPHPIPRPPAQLPLPPRPTRRAHLRPPSPRRTRNRLLHPTKVHASLRFFGEAHRRRDVRYAP